MRTHQQYIYFYIKILIRIHNLGWVTDLQIKEVLILAADRLTVETPRLASERALEYLMHPRGLSVLRQRPIACHCLPRTDACGHV